MRLRNTGLVEGLVIGVGASLVLVFNNSSDGVTIKRNLQVKLSIHQPNIHCIFFTGVVENEPEPIPQLKLINERNCWR